jgi:putative ABC transport system permease protein
VVRNRLPLATRLLLRLIEPAAAARARSDLEEGAARVRDVRGGAAAYRYALRETVGIVFWSGVDWIRRTREGRAIAVVPRRRRASMVGDLVQDVRFGARALRRRPGFTLLTVAILAVGIGAVTSIVTIANALFFAPPPGVTESDRLVRVFRSWAAGEGGSLGYADFLDYRAGARSLSGLAAAAGSVTPATAGLGEALVRVDVRLVSDGWFEVLGVEPGHGRFFRPDENATPGTHPVAVVSWGFWQEQLGGARDAVGGDVVLNGSRFTVVGVTPRGFRGLSPADAQADVYIPILMRNAISPEYDTAWRERLPDSFERWLTVIGRLRPGARIETVQAELETVSARIKATHPTEPQDETVLVTDRYRWGTSTARSLGDLTRLLMAAVGVMLVVAASNVAILMLARASAREREMGVRAALGAGRGRLARTFLTESALVAVAGGAVGVTLSLWLTRVTAALLPVRLDPVPAPDARVLLAALAISVGTALIVGMVPAVRGTRGDVFGTIVGRGRTTPGGRLRDVLVVAQIALSLVLVTGAALFARSLLAARSLDLGFDPANVLSVQVNLRNHGYDLERGLLFLDEALARINALPGVENVTTSRQLPFRGQWTSRLDAPAGVTLPPDAPYIDAVGRNTVSENYFETMRIPIVAGRPIDATDRATSEPVAVVNETFARTVFEGASALGRTIPLRDGQPFTIVGIAQDATYYELGEATHLQVYSASRQFVQPNIVFLVRTSVPPTDLAKPVQDALHAIDANLAFQSVGALQDVADEQVAPLRASAHVVGLSGLIALLLACAGLYGVMAYRIAERTREIGVRMALGATRQGIARRVLGSGMRLAASGVVLGVLGALALGQLVAGLLFGVQPRDTLSLVAAPVILLGVAAVAMIVPVRRAMGIDPVRAMRVD